MAAQDIIIKLVFDKMRDYDSEVFCDDYFNYLVTLEELGVEKNDPRCLPLNEVDYMYKIAYKLWKLYDGNNKDDLLSIASEVTKMHKTFIQLILAINNT